MKVKYDPTGYEKDLQEADVLSWDGDKYITFKDSNGHIDCDKLWKFDIKRSNKLYKLPRGYLKDAVVYSNKAISSELKAKRKGKSLYKVICRGEITKEFKSLNKALKYCKSNVDAYFMSGAFYKKYSSSFTPLLEKEDALWYYYTSVGNVSSKTLNNFTNGVIK